MAFIQIPPVPTIFSLRKIKQAMISLHRMADKGLFREICFFLVFSFQILLDDPFLAFYLDIEAWGFPVGGLGCTRLPVMIYKFACDK